MKTIDSDVAKFSRWTVHVLGTVALFSGFWILSVPLEYGPNPGFGDYAFVFAPFVVAAALLLLAAWLRTQEALDPAYEGTISKSLKRHFVVYGLIAFANAFAVRVALGMIAGI